MSYSEHFRKKILAKLDKGYSIRAVAAQFEIDKNTIVQWKKCIAIKRTHPHKSCKIDNDALRADVEKYPNDDQYKRATHYNWRLKNQTNAIGAIHQQKLFAVGLFDCKINADVFHFWVERLLISELPKNSIVVMDNATFHKRVDTQALLEQQGHQIL